MNKKAGVSEKLKEIKRRQQNWLKQRAESQHNSDQISHDDSSPVYSPAENSGSRIKSTSASSSKTTNSQSGHQAEDPARQSLAQSLIASNKSKAKFKNWLMAKQTETDTSDGSDNEQQRVAAGGQSYNHEKYSNNLYTDEAYRDHKGTGNVKMLKVPNTESQGYASPDTGWNSEDETGEITAATLMSAEDFDSRADDIIAKVKGEMAIKNTTPARNSPRPINYGYQSVGTKVSEHENILNGEQGLSSHVCPTCDKLMMPPSASPMLLIPCGHTLCSSCSVKTKFCAMCGCSVQSSTLNIMLQQIITNFHTRQSHRHSSHKSASQHKIQNNYKEEYQNLKTRQDILQEESENISDNLKKLTRKLNKDQQQVKSIERHEKDIENEIEELKVKLADLREHRLEYEKQCYNVEVQAKQEKNRLILVQDSLTSVKQQIEKVKLLAEDY